ncbi:MAG: flagellar type III secretion system pore protein FliP [Planctomycetia bacterium]|nr:flagellar type III secretion system pore protein FliP [Planctomycetia bacterium]
MKNKRKICFKLGIFGLLWVALISPFFVEAQQNSSVTLSGTNNFSVPSANNEQTPNNHLLSESDSIRTPLSESPNLNNLTGLNGQSVLATQVDTKNQPNFENRLNSESIFNETDQSKSNNSTNATTPLNLIDQLESTDQSILPSSSDLSNLLKEPQQLISQNGIQSSLGILVFITILSLAPAILIMTTSFVRIITVLSILREAIGAGQLPPNQVLTALSLFLTLLIMTPVWTQVYNNAIVPYSNHEIDAQKAFDKGILPIRTFMCQQIERRGNGDDIRLFMQYIPDAKIPEFYEDVPLRALLPAFMLSELKTAFLIGFQLFIPFLIIDMIVSGVLVSMGMMMLPPVMISLPFKLMLFVLMDGWTLVVKMILDSFTLLIV